MKKIMLAVLAVSSLAGCSPQTNDEHSDFAYPTPAEVIWSGHVYETKGSVSTVGKLLGVSAEDAHWNEF